MGEAGSVQSPPVMRDIAEAVGQTTAGAGDVVVSVEEIPSKVVVGQPFLVAISVTNKSLQRLALQLQFRKEVMHGIVCSSASHQVCLCFTTFSWGHRFHLTHYFHLRKTEHWRYGSQDDANSLGRIPRYCWRSSCHSCSSLSRHPITARVYPNGHSSPCTSGTGSNFLVI